MQLVAPELEIVTVPVGVEDPPATVTVTVTSVFGLDGLGLVVIVIVVAAIVVIQFTCPGVPFTGFTFPRSFVTGTVPAYVAQAASVSAITPRRSILAYGGVLEPSVPAGQVPCGH